MIKDQRFRLHPGDRVKWADPDVLRQWDGNRDTEANIKIINRTINTYRTIEEIPQEEFIRRDSIYILDGGAQARLKDIYHQDLHLRIDDDAALEGRLVVKARLSKKEMYSRNSGKDPRRYTTETK